MLIVESLLPEFDDEMAATRSLLERVPEGKLDWKPHEKSMTMGGLASHLADMPNWTQVMLDEGEFDLAPPEGGPTPPPPASTRAEVLERFDAAVKAARDRLASKSDADFLVPWSLKKGGETLLTIPRWSVFRRQFMNHIVHHRGQMTVYLRLNDVPVPQTFGPTADEPDF